MCGAVFVKTVFAPVDFLIVIVLGLFAVGGKVEPVAVALTLRVLIVFSGNVFPAGGYTAIAVLAAVVHPAFPGVVIREHFPALVNPAKEHAAFLVKGISALS